MSKFLFGVSDTQECRMALDCVIKLFGNKTDVNITLLHVTPDILVYADSGVLDYSVMEHTEEEDSKKILDDFEKTLNDAGISCQKLLKNGSPIDVVLEIAGQYDLLIIGSSESSLLHKIFNSHQNSFVNLSPIPVLVAK